MKAKTKHLLIVNTSVFFAVFVMHILRLIFSTEIKIGGQSLPVWISIPAIILVGFLAWQNWTALGKKNAKIVAKVLAAVFALDGTMALIFYFAKLEFWGFSGNLFLIGAGIDAVIFAVLMWFAFKKK